MANERAIVYAAMGEKYLKKAKKSAKSVRSNNSKVEIVLYTNFESVDGPFDTIHTITGFENSRKFRISALIQSQPSNCLFLDCDTYVYEDISELFECLDKFDLGVSQDPIRNTQRVSELPSSFPEYNGGVILFKNNDLMNDFFLDWLKNYKKMDYSQDQPSFRKTLYENDMVEYITLPREYNCRPKHPGYLSRDENAKIIHGRSIPKPGFSRGDAELSEIAEYLNSINTERIHYKRQGLLTSRILLATNRRSKPYFLRRVVQKYGFLGTLRKMYRKIITDL